MSTTLDTKGNVPKITLDDLREALFNGEAAEKTDFDVFEEIAKDKRGLVKKVLQNRLLIEKAGDPDELLHELELLQQRYSREIQTLEAAKSFEAKVEKKSWGRWALDKVKSVVTYPFRHPGKAALIVAVGVLTALGVGYYFAGSWEALLAQVGLGKMNAAVEAALEMAKPTLVTPTEAAGGVMDVIPPAPGAPGPYNPPVLDTF